MFNISNWLSLCLSENWMIEHHFFLLSNDEPIQGSNIDSAKQQNIEGVWWGMNVFDGRSFNLVHDVGQLKQSALQVPLLSSSFLFPFFPPSCSQGSWSAVSNVWEGGRGGGFRLWLSFLPSSHQANQLKLDLKLWIHIKRLMSCMAFYE